MAPSVAYFDLLEDGLVQEVIRHIHGPPYDSWHSLSTTCRRMCTLVRATRRVTFEIDEHHLHGLQHLLCLPRNRAFSNVRALSVYEFQKCSVTKWACFTDAVAAAAATWPMLEEVQFDAQLQKKHKRHDSQPGCLSGPLMALRHVPALRRLTLKLYERHSLTYLPVLTQLTHLELLCEELGSITAPSRRHRKAASPLVDMTNLLSLQLMEADIEGGGRSVLPPNLTRLEAVLSSSATGDWAGQLAGCKQLREVQLTVPWCEMDVYPTVLIQGIAKQLTGLVKLGIGMIGDSEDEGEMMDRFAEALFYNSPEDWGVEVIDLLQLPLAVYGDVYQPAPYVIIPPPNMGTLSGLQHMGVSGWWLAVSSERYWRVLAGCSSLRSLSGLHASVPPPAGVTFPHLTRLVVTTSTSPGNTVTLLGAFPALETLHVTVVPTDSGPDELPAAHMVVLQRLSSAHINFKWPSEVAVSQAVCVAAYCSPLWAALPGLRELVLQWPCSVVKSHTLEGHEAQRRTAAVALGALQEQVPAWYHCPAMPVHVEAGQLLPALQSATQLQSLDLRTELDPGSRDQLVLGLQGALPGLVRLGTLDGAERLAPATLAALRPGLMHALIEY